MLSPAYSWITCADGTRLLRRNDVVTVAVVYPDLGVKIMWQDRVITGQAPDVERAMAGVERWVAKQNDFPLKPRRR